MSIELPQLFGSVYHGVSVMTLPDILGHVGRKQLLLSAIILLAGIAGAVALILPIYDSVPGETKIAKSLSDCPDSDYRCYAAYYATLTYDNDPAAAFADIKQAYNTDSYVKSECHQLVHIIGRTALKKYGSLASAYVKGDNFCWSGYQHGATEQAISEVGGDRIKQRANEICAELSRTSKYSFDHYNCVHGLGHGFMAIDNYDLFKALRTCDRITDEWERSACHGGVFMENVMVATRGGGTSKYLRPDDLLYPCDAVDARYKDQCYLMQSSYILQQNGYDFADAFRLCAAADSGYQNTCYQSIGRDASGSTNSNVVRTKENCDHAPDDNAKRNCMVGAAKDFVSYYHNDVQAREFCKAFGGQIETACYDTVREYYKTF